MTAKLMIFCSITKDVKCKWDEKMKKIAILQCRVCKYKNIDYLCKVIEIRVQRPLNIGAWSRFLGHIPTW